MRVPFVNRFTSRIPMPSLIDAIIGLSLCWTIFQFMYPSWRLPRAPRPTAPPITLNGTATVPGVDWSAASTTVAVSFTLSCQYCKASGDFYRTLAARVNATFDQRLLFISPDPRANVAEWMRSQGVEGYEHINKNFGRFGFRRTPTLALIDHKGRITDIAVGKLSPEEESQVLARLDGKADTPLSIRIEALTAMTGAAR